MAHLLASLKTRHKEIARMSFEGYRPADIASRLEVSYQTVINILKDPLAQAYLQKLEDSANQDIIAHRKNLMSKTQAALDAYDDILAAVPGEDVPWTVYRQSAKDVLDFNGFAPIQKTANLSMTLGKDDIEEIKERALAAGFKDGIIVDVETEEQSLEEFDV